ncbi:FMN-dependent NADH-azoreductase [Mucilaginibacter gynuensis]|uniref:FMN dependent NADH:quinone oxidoreductase n=1 Tax=Mucilaginibacter gynuensis TaxID=1302236 RepID=A0ABP8G2T8_9SPHI
MKKILHIISSPRGAESYSIKLGNAIIDKLKEESPESEVKVHDLTTELFPHLEESHITSFYTPAEQRSPESAEAVKHSDTAIQEIQDADTIVIGAPLYNFGIHSTLKAWIDHISRAGVTFSYSDKGVEGLVKNKKVYLAVSSGGVYSEGPMQSYDFVVPYLTKFLGFIGMTDVTAVRVEGTNIPALKENALQKAINEIAV